MENQKSYQKAKKRVTAKLGFYTHLGIYIAVCFLLLFINLSNSADVLWVKYPIMGWGIGLLFHGLGVFVFSGKSDMVDRMIEKEMEKDN